MRRVGMAGWIAGRAARPTPVGDLPAQGSRGSRACVSNHARPATFPVRSRSALGRTTIDAAQRVRRGRAIPREITPRGASESTRRRVRDVGGATPRHASGSLTVPLVTTPDSTPPEPTPLEPPRHDPFAAMREQNYRRFAFSFVASSLGLQMLSTAVMWEVYERTDSAFMLGLTGLARALPVIALTLPAGTLVDHGDRKRILSTTMVAFGGVALAMAAASRWHAPVWVLFALLVASGCVRSFNAPSRGAILPSLLPASRFENAMAWQSGFFQFAAIAGPLLAGWILGMQVGTWIVYLLTALACTAAGIAVLFLEPRPVARTGAPPRLRDMLAGAGHIWREKTILGALTLDMLAVLFGGATALLPVFARDILGCGPMGLGALKAAPYVGALGMAVWLAMRPSFTRAGPTLLWSVVAFGVSMIVFGLSTSFWLSLAALAVSGAVDNISVVIRHVLVQMRTPDQLRGRTTAVNSVFIECSNEVGAFESGAVAAWLGPVWSVVTGGLGTIGVVAFVALAFPALRRMRRLVDTPQDVFEAEVEESPHRRQGVEGV
jgi:MFS family permease